MHHILSFVLIYRILRQLFYKARLKNIVDITYKYYSTVIVITY